jgi:hypothetical protein
MGGALIALLLTAVTTLAQEDDSGAEAAPATLPALGDDLWGAPSAGRGPFGKGEIRARMERFVKGLFRVGPEDQGPLRAGEADELLEFARDHLPRVHAALDALRRRNPERFAKKLGEHAPRLRHLRRVYQLSPRLGAIIQGYAENLVDIDRGAGALRSAADDSADRQQQLERLRALVAENVHLECEGLEVLASQLEQRRKERTSNRLALLTGDELDPAELPPRVRMLVKAYRAAETEQDRAVLREKLRAAAARHAELEVAALREKAEQMRRRAEVETDTRIERLLQPAPPGPERDRPRRRAGRADAATAGGRPGWSSVLARVAVWNRSCACGSARTGSCGVC